MKIGYARVSTKDQKLDLQIDALKEAGCDRIFQEVMSGAKGDRPVLQEMLGYLREGDVLIIWKLDRLGRSLRHLMDIVALLNNRKIGLQSLNDPIDTTTSHGRLTFNLFASLAEFERDIIRERIQAGLSAATLEAGLAADLEDYHLTAKQSPVLLRRSISKENSAFKKLPKSSTSPKARFIHICGIGECL